MVKDHVKLHFTCRTHFPFHLITCSRFLSLVISLIVCPKPRPDGVCERKRAGRRGGMEEEKGRGGKMVLTKLKRKTKLVCIHSPYKLTCPVSSHIEKTSKLFEIGDFVLKRAHFLRQDTVIGAS